MKQLTRWSIVVTLTLISLPELLHAQGSSACRPADSTSTRMVLMLTNIVTGTDSGSVRQRRQMKLPEVSPNQITYVTDHRICNKLVKPYNAETVLGGGAVQPSGKLYVVKVGSVYVAKDPVKSAGEFTIYVTLDSSYRVIASSLG